MAESDEEYERRNVRDKFRHERNDYESRDDRRGKDQNKGNWSNPRDRRDNDRSNRDRRSPGRLDNSPPQIKRMRREWDDGYPHYDVSYGPHMHVPPRPLWNQNANDLPQLSTQKGSELDYPTQPPMMSFKHFLASQDDNITDEESMKRYNDYKTDFKKQQINEFFVQHKDEEWFRSKYHPDEYIIRQKEIKTSLKNRCDVFKILYDLKIIESIAIDMNNTIELVRLLDSAVIFMEGGTVSDLSFLDISDESNESLVVNALETTIETLNKSPKRSHTDLKDENKSEINGGLTNEEAIEVVKSEVEESSKPDNAEVKPRALHKTQSIFLRNLIPSITKQEVEAMCKRYPGYMRVSIQDPQVERRFARRGWITFNKDVNVKDICWNLNNLRLRDCDMGAIVNRELRQRVRAVNGLTVHKTVSKQDIKHAAKVIQILDNRWNLWNDSDDDMNKEKLGFFSNNPVLKNITEFLVDEADYEDELMGNSNNKDKDISGEIAIERDDQLLKVLDKLILYLRIVYSIDFYGAFEYPNEDEMPHRCGIIHARGQNTVAKITQIDVTEWMNTFEIKITPLLNPKFELDETEAIKLGRKNQEEEVEKFIISNMQELGKDKWLCPLSGKKFKGPEFVRKHILSKHLEKVEEVKKEVIYFNNYLNDPKRIQLPEHPSARQVIASLPPPIIPAFMAPHPFYRPPPVYPTLYHAPFSIRAMDNYRPDFRREKDSTANVISRREKSKPDPRAVISYTDLDAPPEVD